MSDIEVGLCDVCGEHHTLQRKYYHYGIKCDCHSPDHFEIVRHCTFCIPKPPQTITIHRTPIVPIEHITLTMVVGLDD